MPNIGETVHYVTDGRNGLLYELPAMVVVTQASHPGDYPDGSPNPLPVPDATDRVHLVVFTPGGWGTRLRDDLGGHREPRDSADFKSAVGIVPGTGTYVELNVPHQIASHPLRHTSARTWHRLRACGDFVDDG